jgi:hypothetical protein
MDVIASLRVFGIGIKLQDSIGWPQDEKTQLTIDPTKVQESLLTQLSGRNIKFKPKQGQEATGINLGLQTQTEMLSDHRTVERPYVVIHVDKGGINRYALDQIDSLEFTEPEVNAEIVKAYQNNAAKVHEINTLNATSTRLLTTQKRLVGLIKEKAGAEQQIGNWQQEVGTTEESIKKNDTRLPKLETQRDQLQTA